MPCHALLLQVLVTVPSSSGIVWQLDDQTATDHRVGPAAGPRGSAAGPLGLEGSDGSGQGVATHMAVSPDGQFVALFFGDGRLVVMAAGAAQGHAPRDAVTHHRPPIYPSHSLGKNCLCDGDCWCSCCPQATADLIPMQP